jgi:predicted ATPase
VSHAESAPRHPGRHGEALRALALTERLVGRRRELALLRGLLERARCVSLVGPPGIGKSALAAAVARPWTGGAFVVAARGARTRADLAGRVARALGIGAGPRVEEALVQRLAARGPVLVVLDDLDHALRAGAALVGAWRDLAPAAHVLVTARAPLGLRGEQRMELGALARDEATALFVQRAREVRAEYTPRRAARDVIAEIARRLEGNPLALELAAARVGTLSEVEVLAWLPRAVDTVGLRQAIASSWALLDARERADLAACSTFRGGFGLEAAAHVLAGRPDVPAILERLQALRERSLLRAEPGAHGATRFGLYESIADLARAKLRSSGRQRVIERRHAAYYASLAEAMAGGSTDAVVTLAREEGNLAAVAERGLAPKADRAAYVLGLQALVGLEVCASTTGPLAPFLALSDHAERERAVPPRLLAHVLLARGRARVTGGVLAAGVADLDRAADLARRARDPALHGRALLERGIAAMRRGDLDDALPRLEQARGLFHGAGLSAFEGAALGRLGLLFFRRGALEDAIRCYEEEGRLLPPDALLRTGYHTRVGAVHHERGAFTEARAEYRRAFLLARRAGARRAQAIALAALGLVHWETGHHDRARAAHERALAVCRAHGDRDYEGICLATLGGVEATAGRVARATRLLEEARERLVPTGNAHILGALALYEAMALLARAARLAKRDGPGARSLARQARASIARVAGDRSVDGEDVRVALRVLRATFGAEAGPVAAPALVVERAGAWFRSAGQGPVSLARKASLARLLVALTRHRLDARGVALGTFALLAAGWPGEDVGALAGANRVYVALAALRKLGLAPLLLRSGDGYLLDPRADVKIE